MWVADQLDLTVTEIDLEPARAAHGRPRLPPDHLAVRNDAVWAFDKEERVLARLGAGQTWDRFEHPDFTGVDGVALDDHAVSGSPADGG